MPRPRTFTVPEELPCLVYISSRDAQGAVNVTVVDQDPVTTRRDRRMFRALVDQALELADQQDAQDAQQPHQPNTGHYL